MWSGLLGTAFSFIIRFELSSPGVFLESGQLYNRVITSHALLIIFFMVMPVIIGGFGNWVLPLMLGCPDMSFPRLNNLRFWLLPVALILVSVSGFLGSGGGTS